MKQVQSGKYRYKLSVGFLQFILKSYASKPLVGTDLLWKAQKAQGFTDFGKDFNETAFHKLIDSINEESNLHGLGRYFLEQKLLSNLLNRLRAEAFFKRYPEILDKKLPPILLITGMQRTGTTFLQRLLSSLPPFRSTYSWEVLEPVPHLDRPGEEKIRQKSAWLGQKVVSWINPEFNVIHKINWQNVEEDVTLLDVSFMSTVPEAILRVPTFSKWVAAQDNRPAYEYEKKLLKLILKNEKPPKYLILKSPHHMEFLDVFFDVYENVKLIQLHRDAAATVPSMFNLVYFGNKTFCKERDPFEVGQHWFNKNLWLCQRALEARKQIPKTQIMDIAYPDLMAQKTETIKSIFDFLNLEWTKAIHDKCLSYINNNKQYKYGRHSYQSDWYGFTDEEIRKAFSPYTIDQFRLSCQK